MLVQKFLVFEECSKRRFKYTLGITVMSARAAHASRVIPRVPVQDGQRPGENTSNTQRSRPVAVRS
ncbi:hypothetical protein CTI14_06865, partial [Methylobacterium radiotolerans]